MIEFCRSWCEGIIVAVILSIIIESILPEGNHKKYVKVVIGIYIIFTILNPLLGKLDTEIKLEDFDLPTVETATIDTRNIQELYGNGIEETLKNNLEENFECQVEKVQIEYDENYENIKKIELKITENGISEVQKVEIGDAESSIENEKDKEIKKYIAENYEVSVDNIFLY